MNNSERFYGDNADIAAQASQGAVAQIRVCGEHSIEMLAKVFSRPRALLGAGGNTVLYGWVRDQDGKRVDEVLVNIYRAPRSYTGEDGADISCHGGAAAAGAILETLRKAGFKDALPGEFTFRAFLNGKIDLTRSESVMELVSARTKNSLEHAVKRLSGTLEREIKAIRGKLLEAVSAVELFLDYPEDEIEAPPLLFAQAAEEVLQKLKKLAASYERERLFLEGALVVIAGRPNAGKSSLFNALLNEDRSIVTEIPGTTRDWIEASVAIEGIPVRLVDTAGLRDSDQEVEILGIERSKSLAEEADSILYIVDSCIGLDDEEKKFLSAHKNNSLILVWNKIDCVEAGSAPPMEKNGNNFPVVPISAANGSGLSELCASIGSLLLQKTHMDAYQTSGGAGLGTLRQKELTEKAVSMLEEALLLAKNGQSLDIIAPLLRESLNALGEITGEVSTADVLEIMFSRFCLGK